MLNIPLNRLPTELTAIRKNYWRRLLNSGLPNWLNLAMDNGCTTIQTTASRLWQVPDQAQWVMVEDTVTCESLVNNYRDDYVPRYYKRPDHWALIIPTPVGNVICHFANSSVNVPRTTLCPNDANKPLLVQEERYPVTIILPACLDRLLATSFRDIDVFMTSFFTKEGGTADDDTVGRIIEQMIVSNVSELLLWTLAITAATVGVIHHLTNNVG